MAVKEIHLIKKRVNSVNNLRKKVANAILHGRPATSAQTAELRGLIRSSKMLMPKVLRRFGPQPILAADQNRIEQIEQDRADRAGRRPWNAAVPAARG